MFIAKNLIKKHFYHFTGRHSGTAGSIRNGGDEIHKKIPISLEGKGEKYSQTKPL